MVHAKKTRTEFHFFNISSETHESSEDSSSKYLRDSSVDEQADIYDEFEVKRSFSHFI